MKLYFQLMMAVCLLFAGCATHYYKIDADSVNLFLRMPAAKEVYFSTSLDDFELYPTKQVSSGIWAVAVPAKREFTYFYQIDGIIYLPDCKLREKDDFGDENCVFTPEM